MAKCGRCKRPIESGSSERKRKQLSVFIEYYWGKEPSANLEPQYPDNQSKAWELTHGVQAIQAKNLNPNLISNYCETNSTEQSNLRKLT